MPPVRVAVLSDDHEIRMAAVIAFEAAPLHWKISLHNTRPDFYDVLVVGSDVRDIAGIAFDPDFPEQAVAEVARRAERSRIIAVTSASRGVGVTSVALHLAAAAAKRSAGPTSFIDLDRTWNGAAARLTRTPEETKTWWEFDGSQASLGLCALPMSGGFRALFAPPADEWEVRPAIELLDATARDSEVVILDMPAGEKKEDGVNESLDAIVMIVSPSPQGIRRALAALPENTHVPFAFVIDRLGPGSDVTNDELQTALGHQIALELPSTPSLRDAEDECRLLTQPWSRWCRGIDALARHLLAV